MWGRVVIIGVVSCLKCGGAKYCCSIAIEGLLTKKKGEVGTSYALITHINTFIIILCNIMYLIPIMIYYVS